MISWKLVDRLQIFLFIVPKRNTYCWAQSNDYVNSFKFTHCIFSISTMDRWGIAAFPPGPPDHWLGQEREEISMVENRANRQNCIWKWYPMQYFHVQTKCVNAVHVGCGKKEHVHLAFNDCCVWAMSICSWGHLKSIDFDYA